MGADRGSAGLAPNCENMTQNLAQKALVIQVMPKDLLRTEALFFPAAIKHCWKPINTVSNFKRG